MPTGIPGKALYTSSDRVLIMDADQIVWMLQLAAIAAVLIHAAWSDVRTRRASDAHWIVLCAVCIPLYAVRTGRWTEAMGAVVLAVYMLSQRAVGAKGAVLVLAGVLLYLAGYMESGDIGAFSAPAMFLLFWALYQTRAIPGGADAKCLMSLALVMPDPLGIGHVLTPGSVLPPVLPIAAVALMLSLSVGVVNLRRSGWSSARGYRRPVEEVDPVRELPLQRVSGGRIVRARVDPADSGRVLAELSEAGAEEVEVTPLMPFLVPLAVSFLLVVVLGDPFALIGA